MKDRAGHAARRTDSPDQLSRGRQAYGRREFAPAFEALPESDRVGPPGPAFREAPEDAGSVQELGRSSSVADPAGVDGAARGAAGS